MKRFIKLENNETRLKIAKAYDASLPAVSMALNFKRNSRKCIAMRTMAIENGGVLYEESINQKNVK
ncbi:MAG: hypothetical protein LBV72_14715 [Tannerella sp.]|nr:hypothetical protein [Tannerella sp.]